MLDTSIEISTQQFDGPLGLLLHLIQKDEMDIKTLDITKITKQYLEYLNRMKELNFDVAGDYLYMAATLLHIKSKFCLTQDDRQSLIDQFGQENDLQITSESELIRRLEELQYFQRVSQGLWKLPKKGHEVFTKPKVDKKVIVNSILTPMDTQSLIDAMMDFLRKEKRKYTVIKRDRLSIKEKLEFLKNILRPGQKHEFTQLLGNEEEASNIDNIVITFISLLELARLNKVGLFQNELKSHIYVESKEDLQDFDVNLANGFDSDEQDEKIKDDENQDDENKDDENKDASHVVMNSSGNSDISKSSQADFDSVEVDDGPTLIQ